MRKPTLAFVLALAVGTSGCGFRIAHELPVDATFGQIADREARRTPFEAWTVKPYLLAGLVPWNFSAGGTTEDCVEFAPDRRVERLEIATLFSPLDALLRFLPYVSYVLALRTIQVEGVYVDAAPATLAAGEGYPVQPDSARTEPLPPPASESLPASAAD